MELKQLEELIKNIIVDLKDEETMVENRPRLLGLQKEDSRLAYIRGRINAYEVVLELLGKVGSGV